ncbi:MAG: N-acetylmuramoyl-L-alanine amidase family protein [Longimicrobiales bacterium]
MSRAALAVAAALAFIPSPCAAQAQSLRLRSGEAEAAVEVASARGFSALPVSGLAAAGWRVERTPVGVLLAGPRGARLELRDGTPFLRWGAAVAQLVHAPYFEGAELFVPLQLVTDLLPARLPDDYAFEAGTMVLTWKGAPRAAAAPRRLGVRPAPGRDPTSRRVVVIDAGHGGEDPGTVSRSGIREKNVALGVARAMAAELRKSDEFEVVMIRDGDTFVPLWDRGARATTVKGERHGIFVSIHANSAAVRGSPARGFETYFLSEARTEHERRVAAIENAPLAVGAAPDGSVGDLDFILRELKNLDQQHWSSLLAEMVQQEVGRAHPGPDRGVKQAPLAVITNAIMPAVLVEIGYLSHPEEAKLIGEPAFQEEAGKALARAVTRFFQRYPPGSGSTAGEGR